MQEERPKTALVCARGLGDALLSMILARNLSLSGHAVTIFATPLTELKEWFPGFSIRPHPEDSQFHFTFSPFDTVIASERSGITAQYDFGNTLILFNENHFDSERTVVQNIQEMSRNRFKLPFAESLNGMTPLKGLTHRLHRQRVVFHPTSSKRKKNWPAHKFVQLAERLDKQGFETYFCINHISERREWKDLVPPEKLPFFAHLGEAAAFIYESGYLIGNDSGLGHLASALHVPTLSLFPRVSSSTLWRPGWGPGRVIAPPSLIPSTHLKQKYWQSLLSVSRVEKAFNEMRREH